MKDRSILMEPVAFIGEEAGRQAEEFRIGSESDWKRPTFCEGWTRKHIVAHAATGASFYAQVVASGVQGKPQPPFGASDRETFLQHRNDRMARLLDLASDRLVDEFEMEHHRFVRAVESLSLDDLRLPAWHPMGKIPVGHFAGMRLHELALHDWDIRAPEDPGAVLRTHLLTPLLRALPLMQARFLNLRPAADAPDGRFRLVPNEAAPWALSIRRGLASLAETDETEAEVTGDGEALILHTTGRVSWRDAEGQGRLSIQGDRPKAEKLLDALSVSY